VRGLDIDAPRPAIHMLLIVHLAGLLLLAYLMHKGLAINRLGWSGLTALVIGGGAPMVLLANAGLMYAPAGHTHAGHGAGCHEPVVIPRGAGEGRLDREVVQSIRASSCSTRIRCPRRLDVRCDGCCRS
jgi:hypothetical protein